MDAQTGVRELIRKKKNKNEMKKERSSMEKKHQRRSLFLSNTDLYAFLVYFPHSFMGIS